MSTNISNAAPYATASDLVNYYDVRFIGDLLHDDGTRATSTQITTANTAENTLVLVHLARAAGWIEAACLKADRYTPADLATTLQGNSLQLLKWLNCALSLISFYRRRPSKPMPPEIKDDVNDALDMLDMLSEGQRIFALQEAADAGVMEHQVEQPTDVEARDLTTYQLQRFFARRANRWSTAQHG